MSYVIKIHRRSLHRKTGYTDRDQQGQVLVIGLVVAVGLVMVAISVANVGLMVAEKIHVQDTVDAAAYSAAVVEARYMNLSAYVNRAMVANYNSMAFNTASWATVASYDHGLASAITTMYGIASLIFVFPPTSAIGSGMTRVIDGIDNTVHRALHEANIELDNLFAQDAEARDLNEYIERYNFDVLSMYQGLLLAAVQSARHEVAREVALNMDPEVITTTVLGLGAEAFNADELRNAVDYVVRDPQSREGIVGTFIRRFDDLAGSDPDPEGNTVHYLGAVTEASLDRFTAGRNRRGVPNTLRQLNTANLIPYSGSIAGLMSLACRPVELAARAAYAACPFLCGSPPGPDFCDAEFSLGMGSFMRDGQELKISEEHVPVIARQRMREVNFFGLNARVKVPPMIAPPFSIVFPLVGNIVGTVNEDLGDFISDLADIDISEGYTSAERSNDIRNTRNRFTRECLLATFSSDRCSLNTLNVLYGATAGVLLDDHWDGSFDDLRPTKITSIPNLIEGVRNNVEYGLRANSEGKEEGVPKYDWRIDLDNVGFPHYYYDSSNAPLRPEGNSRGGNGNTLAGPSVAIVGVKRARDLKGLRGLGIGNEYDITAISRAQVYYLRNPNRPDEIPSLFNPHWVARLAPIDSEETPVFLKQGLPFLTNYGLSIAPTH